MGLFTRFDSSIKRMHWYDISMVKLSVFFFTLFLLTSWDGFANIVFSLDWYWYLGLTVLAAIPPMLKMLK
jgi:hypothetical protein